jgi:phosphoribosyl 1,2-cyclic phosphodiesterase
MFNVIASGSAGNAVIYYGRILVDCGIAFSLIKPYLYNLQIILLTHEHSDHFNLSTIKRIASERPTLRVGCGSWMAGFLSGFKNVDIYEAGKLYDYGAFQISPVKLYHDVPNFGYRIFKDGAKIIHCTDTAHLEGVTAKDYSLYAIESNYNEETIFDTISGLKTKGEFAYQERSLNSHLSEQQARDFIFKNGGENAKVLRLHESKSFL